MQNEHNLVADKVYAAMETGNHSQARTVLTEYRELHPERAENLRADVIAAYGVAL